MHPITGLHVVPKRINFIRIWKTVGPTCIHTRWYILWQVNTTIACHTKTITVHFNSLMLLNGFYYINFSCCVDETAAQHIAADCIIHFGRSCLTPNSHLPVYYIFPKQPLDYVQCANSIIKTFETDEGLVLVLYDVAYHHVRGKFLKSILYFKIYCIQQ